MEKKSNKNAISPIIIKSKREFYDNFREAINKSNLDINQLRLLAAHLRVKYEDSMPRVELIGKIADKANSIIENQSIPLAIKSVSFGVSYLFLKFIAHVVKKTLPRIDTLENITNIAEDIFNSLLIISAAFFRSSQISHWISKLVRSDYDLIENIDVYLTMIKDPTFNVDYDSICGGISPWECMKGKSDYCTFDFLQRKCKPKKKYQLIKELVNLQKQIKKKP